MKNDPIMSVENLKMYFPISNGIFKKVTRFVKAVDGVDLDICEGETLGLVGESGSGKTTLGRCLIRAHAATGGEVKYFDGEGREPLDLLHVGKVELERVRKDIQMVFQDPYASLDPRMTVFDIIAEPLKLAGKLSAQEIRDRVQLYADKVGLNLKHLNRYPHAFSGGQRQRIGIARALITEPRFIVADEPVSALDVSIQAQILNLLQDIQQEMGLTFLFISHDLRVIHYICDRVAVMYVGKIVELTGTDELYAAPAHPYTRALLSAIPLPDPTRKKTAIPLEGDIANPIDPPSGCYFHPRCPYCQQVCTQEEPVLREICPGHFCACHFAEKLSKQ